MTRIAVLCSGGVDSSVALMRLAATGDDQVTAFYLKIWLEDELAFLGTCPWQEDLEYLRSICLAAGVPLEIIALQREYLGIVVGYALEELRAGRTPSPDVICNRAIKFGAFVDRVAERFDVVASGHHARIARRGGLYRLIKSVDPKKDQTYFLSQLTQDQLARCRFPVGDSTKAEIRAEARQLRLPNSGRPDSQGICFLGRVPYDEFVRQHLGDHPGEIRDVTSGQVLGEHRGTWYHTIGQRRGLGLSGGPWYVVGKDLELNQVLVVHGNELESHARSRFRVPAPSWIATPPQKRSLDVRIRHGEHLMRCTVNGEEDGSQTVDLEGAADPGIAPGQFAVFYDGNECLGGGVIAV